MGLILAPIALILLVIVFIIETVFSFIFETKNRKWYDLVSKRMYRKAKLIDIYSNHLFPEFWNMIFGSKGYQFGELGETLSSVLGKKKLQDTLNTGGLAMYYLLYAIDFKSWKHGGHCYRYRMGEFQIENSLR